MKYKEAKCSAKFYHLHLPWYKKKILQKDLTSENWIKYYQGPETHTTILRVGAMGSGKTTAVDHFIRDILGYNPALFSLVSLDDMITKSQHYVDEVHNIINIRTNG